VIRSLSNAEYLRDLRQIAVANGLCYVCRARPVVPAKRHCQACLDRSRATKQANVDAGLCACGRRTLPRMARCQRCADRHSKRAKVARVEKIDSGICAMSGCTSPRHPDRTLCGVHLDLANIAGKVRFQEKKAKGICPTAGCWNKAKRGGVLCEACLERLRAYRRERRGAAHG
jgi:hypothetical protein